MMRNFPPQKISYFCALPLALEWHLNTGIIEKKGGMETVLLKPFFVIYLIFFITLKLFSLT